MFRRYGIYGLSETPEELEDRMELYLNGSFVKLLGSDRMHISLTDTTLLLSDYAMSDTARVREAIVRKVKTDLPEKAVEWKMFSDEKGSGSTLPRGEKPDEDGFRTLRNSAIRAALPSYGIDTKEIDLSGLEVFDPGSLVRSAGEEALINLYAKWCFSTYRTGKDNTFFRNEIEYILSGKTSDKANLSAAEAKLAVLRGALNAAYLYSSPLRQQEAAALAVMISGAGAVWTTQAILAVWNLAESALDVRTLLNGGAVPLMKTDETWVLSVESILPRLLDGEGSTVGEEPVFITGTRDGLRYDAYLMMLLFFENKETKLLRIMDLIQLNMIATSQGSFSWQTTYAGFETVCTWRQTRVSLLPPRLRCHTYTGEIAYFGR